MSAMKFMMDKISNQPLPVTTMTNGKVNVTLVGVVHIAPDKFFDQVTEFGQQFPHDGVLLEGIQKKETKNWTFDQRQVSLQEKILENKVPLYRFVASMLNINDTSTNWVDQGQVEFLVDGGIRSDAYMNDLPFLTRKLLKNMGEKAVGEDIITLMLLAELHKINSQLITDPLLKILQDNTTSPTKGRMVVGALKFIVPVALLKIIGAEKLTSAHIRDEHLMGVLDTQIAAGVTNFYVPWGASHQKNQVRLLENRGFTVVNTMSHTASEWCELGYDGMKMN